MSISEELMKNVAEKNISAIRNDLLGDIPFDLNFSKDFKESLDYCLGNGISDDLLYAEHDGRELSDEVSKSNFDKLYAQLRTNFSKERLEKIKEIGRKLYPVLEEKPISQTSSKSSSNRRRSSSASSSKNDSGDSGLFFAVGAGIFIGALGGGLLGGLLFEKAIVGALAGAAIGAGVGAGVGKTSSNK